MFRISITLVENYVKNPNLFEKQTQSEDYDKF